MEKNLKTLATIAILGFLFFTPLGWAVLAAYIILHLHPVYWLYRIAKALEKR